ncbi:NADP-reducing hydrogenase subunit HndD [bioreactor metagenome]|uniref:NADP-reducing hydrogenase subunit HndD n=1 Tax=bioreactor metagenome TaxID=1076179 RepID=A0A645GHK6_9ZZZZ
MPCTAKKFEAKRPEHYTEYGAPYTDVSLTTRELIWMIKSYGIDFTTLPVSSFDTPFGESSGAADIFGSTGGVMEAAIRTAVEEITGKALDSVEFEQVRAVEGLREATLNVDGLEVNVAVANGLNNAKILLEKVKRGEKQYHIIEIMACPGGCLAGGGQPYFASSEHTFPMDPAIIEKRRKALYNIDANKKIRKSHANPAIKQIYDEFLEKPGSHIAHNLLHTHYSPKEPRGIK